MNHHFEVTYFIKEITLFNFVIYIKFPISNKILKAGIYFRTADLMTLQQERKQNNYDINMQNR